MKMPEIGSGRGEGTWEAGRMVRYASYKRMRPIEEARSPMLAESREKKASPAQPEFNELPGGQRSLEFQAKGEARGG
jgi:hypothetical protein